MSFFLCSVRDVQLRLRNPEEMRGRLNVHFVGEEGIDAGGLTREWYQLLSRVVFDRGALLFTTVGNGDTFQPNPNSKLQTGHLSYFKFVGRVVSGTPSLLPLPLAPSLLPLHASEYSC